MAIFRVTSVTASIRFVYLPGPPPTFRLRLVVNARGLTRTTGWTNGRLVPKAGVFAADTKAFDFIATPPNVVSQPTLTPITAREWTGSFSASTTKVVVYAEDNKIQVAVSGMLIAQAQKAVAEHKKAAKAAKAPVKKKAPAKKTAAKPAPKKKTAPKKGKKK